MPWEIKQNFAGCRGYAVVKQGSNELVGCQSRAVQISMPNYISKLLHTLQHQTPAKPQDSPHAHVPIKYGATSQLVIDPPQLARVSDKDIKYVQ